MRVVDLLALLIFLFVLILIGRSKVIRLIYCIFRFFTNKECCFNCRYEHDKENCI